MSFYASKEIEDRLGDFVVKEKEKENDQVNKFDLAFSLSGSLYFTKIKSIKSCSERGRFDVVVEANNHLLEKIFFDKVDASEIFIGSTKKKVKYTTFLEVNRIDDYYLLKTNIQV